MKHQHIYDLCKQHMHSYVLVETEDGTKFDGILTGLDDEFAYFAVPIGAGTEHLFSHGMMGNQHNYNQQLGMYGSLPNYFDYTGHYQEYRHDKNEEMQKHTDLRQPFYGYGFPGYGFGFPGYGYGFGYRPRRFARIVLPLAALVALSALPWY